MMNEQEKEKLKEVQNLISQITIRGADAMPVAVVQQIVNELLEGKYSDKE